MRTINRSRLIHDAPFHCDASERLLQVWGPCNLTMRIAAETEPLYCNLHEATPDDGIPVQTYTDMLDFAATTAVAARRERGLVYRSTDLLAHCFLRELAAAGIDLMEVARLNAEDAEKGVKGVCHSHDFCDANMAMLSAASSLGLTTGDGDDDLVLWNAAWEVAIHRLAIHHAATKSGSFVATPVGLLRVVPA